MLAREMAGELTQARPLAALEARGGDYVLSIKDTARILSVCSRTVWRLIEDRKLRAIRLSERRRGILASELSRYLSAEPDAAA